MEMKKIAILTQFYSNANYGGLLQAFALQKCIQNLGFNSKQISYVLDSGYPGYTYRCIINRIKTIVKEIIHQEWYIKHKEYESKVLEFTRTIPHTEVLTAKKLSILNDNFDAFIVGSDQVWNPIGWQRYSFLSFANKPKISYAASIARDTITEDELAIIQEYTSDFFALSVREKNNAEFLTKKLHREFQLMPDPTLLFTKEEWNSFFSHNDCMKKPYIFAYFLGFNEIQRNECIKFAQDNELDIYFIPYIKKESFSWDKGNEKYCLDDYRVENFISLIRNAELILTDSFHGAVFSCIFEKPFYVLNRELIGKEKSMNSRLETLFYELSIPQDRMIDSVAKANEYEFSIKEIEAIRMAKNKWREIGLNYIRISLEKI